MATAENGRVAVAKFRNAPADLVVTTIVMPEQDGIATIMALRHLSDQPKIIATAGEGRVAPSVYLKWALMLGADEALAKPFQPAMLVAKARQLLGLDAPPQLELDFEARRSAMCRPRSASVSQTARSFPSR